jgi:hypothetical protein
MKKLIPNKILIGGTTMILAATAALGADEMGTDKGGEGVKGAIYRGNELSLDLFGSGSLGKYSIDHLSGNTVRYDTRLGAGAGLNYFFTRNIGIGGDAYSENTSGPFIDSASGNLILRLPLGESGFSPYIYGGGGHQFELAKVSFAQAGAGMEFRFTPHVGVFLDARWVLPDKTQYYGVGRLGMRLAF